MRLISSLTQFIKQATQNRPWLLILEDLQWVDEGSLELLRYLSRHLREMSLMIVGTYRDMEVESEHPLRMALRDLDQTPAYRHLPLDRLSQADVTQLLVYLWDPTVPQPLCETIYRHTEGNPLYVEEVAKGLMDDGLVTIQVEQWHFPEMKSIHLPQSIYDSVERRIHYLNAETRDLLSQAAVLGQTFRFDDVVAMSGLSERAVLDHLDLALERQLAQEVSEQTIRFRHAEIHHVIYNDLGGIRRRRLHWRAGEAIEQGAQPDPKRLADELAFHFSEAGELERALVYSIPAARQAQAAYANETALQWYGRTLDMLDQLDTDDTDVFHSLRLSVYRSMGEVLQLIGRWNQAHECYQQAADLADAVDDRSSRAWCQTDLCNLLIKQGRFSEALETLLDTERTFRAIDDQAGLAQVDHYRGTVAAMQSDFEAARSAYEASLQIRQTLGDQAGMVKLFSNLGIVARQEGDFATARAFYEKGLAIERQLDNPLMIAVLLNNLSNLALNQGEYTSARTYSEEAVSLVREVGAIHDLAVYLHTLSDIVRSQGDYLTARRLYRESLRIYQDLGDQQNLAEVLEGMGRLAALQEQPERAYLLINAAQTLRESIGVARAPDAQDELDRLLTLARQHASEETVPSAIAEDRAMTLEEAIEYALQDG